MSMRLESDLTSRYFFKQIFVHTKVWGMTVHHMCMNICTIFAYEQRHFVHTGIFTAQYSVLLFKMSKHE